MHGQCRGSNAVDGWHTTTKIGTGTGTDIDRLSHPLQPDTQYWMTVSSGDEYPSGISNNELIYGYRYSCWGWPHSLNSSKTVATVTISCRRKERSFPRVLLFSDTLTVKSRHGRVYVVVMSLCGGPNLATRDVLQLNFEQYLQLEFTNGNQTTPFCHDGPSHTLPHTNGYWHSRFEITRVDPLE